MYLGYGGGRGDDPAGPWPAIIVWLSVMLSLALMIPLAGAGPCGQLPEAPCTNHLCSNDSATPSIVGDELMCWSPSEGATEYRVMKGSEICDVLRRRWNQRMQSWLPPLTYWRPYATSNPYCWPRLGQRNYYSVVACNCEYADHPCGCSPASNEVEFEGMPYRCFNPTGEVACQ